MAWGSPFLQGLTASPLRPTWALEVLQGPIGGACDLYTSHGNAALLSGLPRVNASSVRPVSWTRGAGTWTVRVACDGARASLYAPRGSLVRLLCGFSGMAREDMEPVALGVVRTVSGGPGFATIEAWDILTGMTTRLTTSHAYLDLFNGIATSTTTTAAYTVGAATLDVTDATQLTRQASGTGCVRVTPDTGADPFFLTYTGVTGNQLTGVSAAGQFGTTASVAAIGSAVENIAYIYGHPFDVARKILTSGSGSGAYDLLPDTWGICVDSDFLDHDDIDDWKSRVGVSSGSYQWDVLVDEPISDGIGWLSGLLSVAGIWITVRQGRIVLRCAQDTDTARMTAGTVTEEDLAQGDAWSWWDIDPEISEEAKEVKVLVDGSSYTVGSNELQTLPATARRTYDLSGVVFSNGTAIATETCRRLAKWAVRPPELFEFRCRGWRMAQWCEGDVVTLHLPRLRGRLTARSGSYDGWLATVASAAPDYGRHETVLRVWPDRESAQ